MVHTTRLLSARFVRSCWSSLVVVDSACFSLRLQQPKLQVPQQRRWSRQLATASRFQLSLAAIAATCSGRGSLLRLSAYLATIADVHCSRQLATASRFQLSSNRSNVHWSRQLATASRLQWNSHVSQHALNSTSMSHAMQHDWPPLKEAVSWFS